MPTRIQIAKPDIVRLFERNGPRLYSHAECAQILEENRAFWRLAQSMSAEKFISYLIDRSILRRIECTSLTGKSPKIKYAWGEVSIFREALSFGRNGYFSHSTAVFLHGLTEQLPMVIYINEEQSAKPARGPTHLSQEAIHTVFRRPQRESSQIYDLGDHRLVFLSGKNTGRLEVADLLSPTQEAIPATKLERTLIDIVVRPTYAGGIYQVIEAFRAAKARVSTNVLVATLKKLSFTYPYHQAIGFIMERAGYEPYQLELLRRLGLEVDFYLIYGMSEPRYDADWRLYVPVGL